MANVDKPRPSVNPLPFNPSPWLTLPAWLKAARVWGVRFPHGENPKQPFVVAQGEARSRWKLTQRVALVEAFNYCAANPLAVPTLVLGPDDGFTAIDFDGARDPATGRIESWAEPLLTALLNDERVVVCVSQSGYGYHAVLRSAVATEPVTATGVFTVANKDPAKAGKAVQVEVYHRSKRHIALTGRAVRPVRSEEPSPFDVAGFVGALPAKERTPKKAGPVKPAVQIDSKTLALVDRALAALDPDCGYARWVKIGMALRNLGDEEGYQRFVAWSARGRKFFLADDAGLRGEDCCHAKWSSFKPQDARGGIGLRSLYFEAWGENWQDEEAKAEFEPVPARPGLFKGDADAEDEPEDDGRPPRSDTDLASRYIFVKGQDRYFDRESLKDFSRSAIDAAHRLEQIQGLTLGGKKKAPKASHYVDVNCEMADDFVWFPGRPLLTEFQGTRCVNTFRAPEAVEAQPAAGPNLWDEHVEYLIPDAAQREHFLNVMAFGVQYPDRKVNHAVVLYEPTGGTGKDVMLQPFRRWLHKAGWVETNLDALGSQFQHYLDGAKFLCVQEARDMEYGKSHHLYNQMKNVIAAPPDWLTVNKKNRQPYNVPNVVQVIFQTNYENGVYYENVTDRRYFVVECATVPKDAAYYSRLVKFIDENWRVIIGRLLARDLSRFQPGAPPPQTAMKERMHKATRPQRDAELDLLLEEQGERPFTLSELRSKGFGRSSQLQALLNNPTGLGRDLEKRGYKSGQGRAAGTKLRLWFKAEYDLRSALLMYAEGAAEA